MNVIDALQKRKSTRAFLEKPVSKEKIEAILRAARHAPSGTNAQPWQVAVVSGKKKNDLCQAMVDTFCKTGEGSMDYHYYPQEWHEPFKKRRVVCGSQLYSALNIDRQDKERRLQQWIANYRAFDAPVVLFFFLHPAMQKGSFLDFGMFLQSLMLAAVEEGLATCAQASLGQFPDLVKDSLGYSRENILLCGMALGYEDPAHPVNNYRTEREEIEVFTRFIE